MLNQRDKMTITNRYDKVYKDDEIIKFLNEEKLKGKKEKLIEYLKRKRGENTISSIDLILIKYLGNEFNDDINNLDVYLY